MKRFAAPRLLALVLLFCLSTFLSAQPSTIKSFVMQKVVFKGSRLFKDAQLLAAMDMKVGGSYSQQQLQDFANKLSNTGLFSQVAFRFTPTDAEFDLTDNPGLVPVRFDNCVWIDDAQMLEKLKQREPLFTGVVPPESTFAEDVGAKMEGILAESGVHAKVQFMPAFDAHGGMTALAYTVIDPRIEIAAIHFADVPAEVTGGLQNAAKKINGKDYTRDVVSAIADASLKPVLQEKGYLRAEFADAAVKLMTSPSENPAKVELTVPVRPGAQYRSAGFQVKGDDPIARDAAKQVATYKTGEIANLIALREKFAALGGPYLAQGYMSAKVKTAQAFDDAAHTVTFTIELVPGDQYKITKLNVQGLDDAQTEKLSRVWTLKVGDPYDATYARNFFQNNAPKLGFLNGAGMAWTQRVNDQTKTVELTVFFRKGRE